MRNGEFAEGSHVLRARIDMASPNLNLRDPVIYRILKVPHHRTGDTWCIYPMYDYTHCLSDAIEGITHSLCTLEFEDHRPLYDWVLDTLQTPCHPQQIEFARLNLTYTVMSKRKLLQLVKEGYVDGWDDPRMLTISGLRRRGYTPAAIRSFCNEIGLGKRESWIDMTVLENAVRDDLNVTAPRVMCVLDPVKVVIDNYPEDQAEELEAANHPQDPAMGSRKLPFSRELYIERADFMDNPPAKFHRLGPGREVRLRYGYLITCTSVVKDEGGADPGDPLHLRPRHQRRVGPGRPQGQGDHPLGLRRSRPALSGPTLRSTVCRRKSGGGQGYQFQAAPQSPLAHRHRNGHGRTVAGRAGRRHAGAVRAAGVLLCRYRRLGPRQTGLQPDRHPARHLGQDPAEARLILPPRRD